MEERSQQQQRGFVDQCISVVDYLLRKTAMFPSRCIMRIEIHAFVVAQHGNALISQLPSTNDIEASIRGRPFVRFLRHVPAGSSDTNDLIIPPGMIVLS